MRMITGAILIFSAIWLFAAALPYSLGEAVVMVKLAIILAGITAILGVFYLFIGSVEAKENSRWYQFSIKSLLLLTVMVALFFSGRALGLHEAASQLYPTVACPVPYATPTAGPFTVVPAPNYSPSAPVSADSYPPNGSVTPCLLPGPLAPQQPPRISNPENPLPPPSTPAPPWTPAAQTP